MCASLSLAFAAATHIAHSSIAHPHTIAVAAQTLLACLQLRAHCTARQGTHGACCERFAQDRSFNISSHVAPLQRLPCRPHAASRPSWHTRRDPCSRSATRPAANARHWAPRTAPTCCRRATAPPRQRVLLLAHRAGSGRAIGTVAAGGAAVDAPAVKSSTTRRSTSEEWTAAHTRAAHVMRVVDRQQGAHEIQAAHQKPAKGHSCFCRLLAASPFRQQ